LRLAPDLGTSKCLITFVSAEDTLSARRLRILRSCGFLIRLCYFVRRRPRSYRPLRNNKQEDRQAGKHTNDKHTRTLTHEDIAMQNSSQAFATLRPLSGPVGIARCSSLTRAASSTSHPEGRSVAPAVYIQAQDGNYSSS